jgi:hypothetical protein
LDHAGAINAAMIAKRDRVRANVRQVNRHDQTAAGMIDMDSRRTTATGKALPDGWLLILPSRCRTHLGSAAPTKPLVRFVCPPLGWTQIVIIHGSASPFYLVVARWV